MNTSEEPRTVRDRWHTIIHVQPRFVLLVMGWGAPAGEKCFFSSQFESAEWARIKSELVNHTTKV